MSMSPSNPRFPLFALTRAIRNLDQRLRKAENHEESPGVWNPITLLSGWSNVGGAYAPAGEWHTHTQTGVILLRGRITGGAFPSQIATLPVHHVPEYTQTFNVPGGVIEVRSTGQLWAISGASPLSLDGINYRAFS